MECPPTFRCPTCHARGGPNFLGAKYAPFVVSSDPNGANFRVRDVELPNGIDDGRFEARRQLRKIVDRMPRYENAATADPVAALDEFYDQGIQLITTPEAQRAFEIDKEPDAVRDAYGRNSFGQRACSLAD